MKYQITKTTAPKAKPTDASKLGFGKIFSDHMLIADYENGAWKDHRIVPYGNLSLSPASSVLHYGQEIFEGLKAYKTADGKTHLFRAKDNFRRMNESARRLCLPELDVDAAYEGLCELIKLDEDWIPTEEGTSLYIRPTMFGNDEHLGVSSANRAMFYIILSPSGAYYAEGLKPVGIYVEDEYVRATPGGMGFAKTGGNYAASLLAGEIAKKKGYSQVLWLDGIERKYVEEVGAMNIMFLFGDELAIPALQGTILAGITRASIITLAQEMGYKVSERAITIDEVIDGAKSGKLKEAFGTGTAAVVSPVGHFFYQGSDYKVGDGGMGELTQKLYDTLTGIQYGRIKDTHGWITEVK